MGEASSYFYIKIKPKNITYLFTKDLSSIYRLSAFTREPTYPILLSKSKDNSCQKFRDFWHKSTASQRPITAS
jgi:hypothetical protein